jgi:hypothetical protein
MAASLGHVLSQLQRWTAPRLGELSDIVLLERFVQQRDESAFAAQRPINQVGKAAQVEISLDNDALWS